MIPPDHERRIKAAILQVLILCLCALVLSGHFPKTK